jgi:hypothetical protein
VRLTQLQVRVRSCAVSRNSVPVAIILHARNFCAATHHGGCSRAARPGSLVYRMLMEPELVVKSTNTPPPLAFPRSSLRLIVGSTFSS